jgi:hypothetical protein
MSEKADLATQVAKSLVVGDGGDETELSLAALDCKNTSLCCLVLLSAVDNLSTLPVM